MRFVCHSLALQSSLSLAEGLLFPFLSLLCYCPPLYYSTSHGVLVLEEEQALEEGTGRDEGDSEKVATMQFEGRAASLQPVTEGARD